MATVIEFSSLTVVSTRASSLPPTTVHHHRRSVKLPKFRGLRINQSLRTNRSSFGHVSLTSAITRGGATIVCEAMDTSLDVPPLDDESWDTLVLKSEFPVLVEFWAPWCGPCRMIHPVIDELARQYTGKLKCFRVNTDDCPVIASQYGIRSIPTVIIFKDGEKKDAVIGAVPKSTLTSSIEKFL
ncbi:hypothetical protein ACFE04_005838 [Oxalis oulophora]